MSFSFCGAVDIQGGGGGGGGGKCKIESLQILDLQWLASLLIANTTNAHLSQIE